MAKEPTCDELKARIRQLEDQLVEFDDVKTAHIELKEKYRVLVENANDAIFVLQDGVVRLANSRALEIGGVLAEELDSVHFSEYLHPEEKEKVVGRYRKRLKGEKVLNMYPFRMINRQGEVVWVEVNAVLIEWQGRPATLNIVRDITSQKLFENQYFQTDSLATVRTLAGGLAHGFNNLLMGIQGSASLLALSIDKHDPLYQDLERIETCVDQAAKLAKQLVGFAQCGKYNVRQLDLNQIVEEVVSTLGRGNKQIHIQKDYASDLWPVEGDQRQIDQVLMNILLNAWQAIKIKGVITIKTCNTTLQEVRVQTQGIRPGKYIKISVQDSGMGMDETICKRVFEPFFTTKGAGLNRGLGLACAYGIVANHNGMIDVTSAKNIGTTFSVLLPVMKKTKKQPSSPDRD